MRSVLIALCIDDNHEDHEHLEFHANLRRLDRRLTDYPYLLPWRLCGVSPARVGGGATWVDDAVVWGVGGPGGVWGYR